jgi:NAD(P)-dependent dehydrogenase (short-subunit alcohol dehydrogenase family)
VFVVLGATGGIGTALCRQLLDEPCQVVAVGRRQDRLDALADALGVATSKVDATEPSELDSCVSEVLTRHGRLDGIANCIGSLLLKPAHLTTPDEWTEVLRTNLGSAFATVRAASRAMRKTGGSIVLTSSAAARLGMANHEAIAAAKAGVIGLMLAAAASYARHGIRVNAVAPGLVETPLTSRLTSSDQSRQASVAMHPLKRLGAPDDVAAAIAWLMQPQHSWVTGQTLGVDGGLATLRTQ